MNNIESEKSNHEDDSHQRWSNQRATERNIWDKYDQTIAPEIVRSALLEQPTIQFMDLYHRLSIARLRCECEKSTVDDIYRNAHSSDFGKFQLGGSYEFGVYGGWGKRVSAMLQKRRMINHSERGKDQHGLSAFGRPRDSLSHPSGDIRDSMEHVFKKMLSTSDFFEYMQLAAEMMYNLSNFPMITRGSAAVNSWLIDNIAKQKFKIDCSIRPDLYDWVSFMETPEQYTSFFVIAATTKYLKSIPAIYQKHKEFLDSIPSLLIENPNLDDIQLKRKACWEKLQSCLADANLEATTSESPDEPQLANLANLSTGQLIFRTHSGSLIQFYNLLKECNPKSLTEELIDGFLNESNLSKVEVKNLFHLHHSLKQLYLQSKNEPENKAELHSSWADLELLRMLPDSIWIKLAVFLDDDPDCILESEDISQLTKRISELANNFSQIDSYRKISFALWQDIAQLSAEVVLLFDTIDLTDSPEIEALKETLQTAVIHGQIKMQELIGLDIEDIKKITSSGTISSAAISLYKNKPVDIASEQIPSNLGDTTRHFRDEANALHRDNQKCLPSQDEVSADGESEVLGNVAHR
jgi:hypothetical protein